MTMLPVRTALLWIWGSTIVFSGGVVLALSLKQKWNSDIRNNPKFLIQSMIQKCTSVESLSTDYLAECLGLSLDSSFTIFDHSAAELAESLEASPLIKSVVVSKILPSTLHVEYTLRQPIAILHDYQNTVVDEEGVLFPLQPFRTPKLLPEIVLGDNLEQKMPFALELVTELKRDVWPKPIKGVRRIDLTRFDTPRLSRREIILVFNCESDKLVFLRLSTRDWKRGLDQFLKVPSEIFSQQVFDMRLPNVAYVTPIKEEPKGVQR